MIVIASKTEFKLRDDLRHYARTKSTQRCFFLEFSKTDIQKDVLFETFLRLLEEIPNSYMAKVYLCRDKDILIMMEDFMQRQFLDFVKKLANSLGKDDLTDVIDIFQIGVHWEKLQALYTEKIEAINRDIDLAKEDLRRREADKNTMQVMAELDSSLVENVAQRRSDRRHPLIMVADDDRMSRTLAGNVLRGDYDIAYAQNGSESMKEYVTAAPDILFLDIGMPDIGGQEVLECLFQIDPDAYIIMFSGRKDKTTIMTSLEKGARGFLGKPFTREQLFTHVENSPFIQAKQSRAA